METSINTPMYDADENENIQAQKETFVASLSHDLKNPTIAQIRAIELILKGAFGQVLPQQRKIMEMVLDSCKYMNAMLCCVLTTYSSQKGTVFLQSEKVSIADITEECIEEMIYLANDKEIHMHYVNNSDNESVWGDKVQLKRVIINLLSNSIKYAYRNTEIFIEVYNESHFTCFKFENCSPYITPDKQNKIFAKYISYSQANLTNGIGLGLYASKKITEAHGGKIFVQSYENNKNIFGFKIPNDESLKNIKRSVTF